MADTDMDVLDMAKRLEQIPTDTLFDVMEPHGFRENCVLSLGIRPLVPGVSRAGRAFTWRMVRDPRRREEWNPPGLEAISAHFDGISEGDVVVVDSGGDRDCGDWGEMLSIMARNAGARGAIIDGGTRDSAGIKKLDDWAVFARYTSPIESVGRRRIHETQVPVVLDGQLGSAIVVRPGDWLVADDDAVVVIPAEMAATILQEAEALEEVEEGARQALLRRVPIDEVFARFGRA